MSSANVVFPRVEIRGGGVAAYCCAHLLNRAGVPVLLADAEIRVGVPAILIGDGTQSLLADVFERRDLFAGLPRIERRIVAWGPGAVARVVPHSAVVVSELELLGRLRSAAPDDVPDTTDWTIYAGRGSHVDAQEHAFGSRRAAAVRVKLREGADRSACWIESLEDGWLFLIPGLNGEGWLLAVGGPVEKMLRLSRVIGAEIEELSGSDLGKFPAYPRISDPLGGAGWLACGATAMGFDPLCGDGVGNAVREAILAAAVVRGMGSGQSVPNLVAHYQTRLFAGFARHLEQCLPFYDCGHTSPWWTAEQQALRQGIEWCRAQLERAGPYRYRLAGFELERIS